MKSFIKKALVAAALTVSFGAASVAAESGKVPSVIKIVVPFSAGAGTDVVARALANQLASELSVTVIVENKPGASGMIGARQVANGPKDGSELMVFSNSLISAAATLRNMPFDLLKDLDPVAALSQGPMIVTVAADSPIKTPADLIEAAKARPTELNHGTGGMGTIAHMAVELMAAHGGVKLTHIPYKGAAPAVTDLVGGTLDLMVGAYSTFAPVLDSGRLRAIAVTTAERAPAFPDLPPMADAAPGFSTGIWIGLWAPAGLPEELLERLNKAVINVTHSEQYANILKTDGHSPSRATPAELKQKVADDYATWRKVAADNNIVID